MQRVCKSPKMTFSVGCEWSWAVLWMFCSCLLWCEQLWGWKGCNSCLISLEFFFSAHSHLLQPPRCLGLSLLLQEHLAETGETFPGGIPGGKKGTRTENPSPCAGCSQPAAEAPKTGNDCPRQCCSNFSSKNWEWLSQAVLLPLYFSAKQRGNKFSVVPPQKSEGTASLPVPLRGFTPFWWDSVSLTPFPAVTIPGSSFQHCLDTSFPPQKDPSAPCSHIFPSQPSFFLFSHHTLNILVVFFLSCNSFSPIIS